MEAVSRKELLRAVAHAETFAGSLETETEEQDEKICPAARAGWLDRSFSREWPGGAGRSDRRAARVRGVRCSWPTLGGLPRPPLWLSFTPTPFTLAIDRKDPDELVICCSLAFPSVPTN